MKFADLVSKDSKKCKIWLDLSTFCNASCPQCHRTDANGLGKVDWLPLIKWSLKDFIRQFPPGSIDATTRMALVNAAYFKGIGFLKCSTVTQNLLTFDASKSFYL